jgi:hypothetical protein
MSWINYMTGKGYSISYVCGVRAMKRLCVLLCALFLGLGCASDVDKAKWNDAWKDARGDNMQMKGFSRMDGADDHSGPIKSPE